jgi:putative ABC transport system permease protein
MTSRGPLPRPRVPLARRVLFADRRRGALTVAGVAAALLLVLVLDAIFAGALRRVTAYVRTSPADVLVSQAGVRTMHMSYSNVPSGTVTRVAAVPGAAWAAPIAFAAGALIGGPEGQQLTYLIGYDPATGRGGPVRITTGHTPGLGETVVDSLAAEQLGLRVGGTAVVAGTRLRIVGLTGGGTSITNTTTFVSLAEFTAMRGPTVSYVLVRAAPEVSADALAQRVAAEVPGVMVQTRAQFVASEARIVTDMSADLIRLMALIGLVIALAVIALGLLTTTLARLREYAVLKALGATTGRLAGIVVGQVGWIVGLALTAATLTALALAAVLPAALPTVQLVVTPGSVVRVGVAALAAGGLAALLPLRRVARVDPATAFREAR